MQNCSRPGDQNRSMGAENVWIECTWLRHKWIRCQLLRFAAGITSLILGKVSSDRQFIERLLRHRVCANVRTIIANYENWMKLACHYTYEDMYEPFNYAQDVSKTWIRSQKKMEERKCQRLWSARRTRNNPIYFCPRLIKYIVQTANKCRATAPLLSPHHLLRMFNCNFSY